MSVQDIIKSSYKQADRVKSKSYTKQLSASRKKKKKKISFTDRAPDTKRMSRGGTAYETTKYSKQINKNLNKVKRDSHKQGASVSKSVKLQQKQSYDNTAGGRFTQGFIRNTAMMGMPKRTESTYYDENDKKRKVSASKAYKAGEIIGDFVSYGTGYGLAGKAIAKATGKAVAKQAGKQIAKETAEEVAKKGVRKTAPSIGDKVVTKAGEKILKSEEKIAGKLAGTKAFQKAGEKAVEKGSKRAVNEAGKKLTKEAVTKDMAANASRKITQNLISDATVGTALDTAHAYGEGIDIGANKDYLTYMGTNALLNVGMGAGMEGLSAGARALLNKAAARSNSRYIVQLVNGKRKLVRVPNDSVKAENTSVKAKPKERYIGTDQIKTDYNHGTYATYRKANIKNADGKVTIPKKEFTATDAVNIQKRVPINTNVEYRKVQRRNTSPSKVTIREGDVTARRNDAVLNRFNGKYVSGDKSVRLSDVEERIRPNLRASQEIRSQSVEANNLLARAKTSNNSAWKNKGFRTYLRDNGIDLQAYANENNISVNDAVKEHYKAYRGENVVRKTRTETSTANINSARETADDIVKRYGADNKESTAKYIKQIKEAKDAGNEALVDRIASKAAKDIVDSGGEINPGDSILAEIQKDLKHRKLHVDKNVTKEFAEGWGKEKQLTFGKLNVSSLENAKTGRNAINSLDSNYTELQELYGKNYFPDADTPQEQYQIIRNLVMQDASPKKTSYYDMMGEFELEALENNIKKALIENADTVTSNANKRVAISSRNVNKTELDQFANGKPIEYIRATRGDDVRLADIVTDRDFKRYLNDNNIDLQAIRNENGLTNREAIEQAYDAYKNGETLGTNQNRLYEVPKDRAAEVEPAAEVPSKELTINENPSGQMTTIKGESVRQALDKDAKNAYSIEGYTNLDEEQRKLVNKAMSDDSFKQQLRANDEKALNSISEGASERKITEADQLARLYQKYEENGGVIPIAKEMVTTSLPKPKFIEQVKEVFLKAKEQFSDSAESIYQYSKKVKDPELYQLFDRARQVEAHSEQMINGEKQIVLTRDGGYKEIGKSIKGIFDPIVKRGDEYYIDFQSYIFNKHNINRYAKGKPVYSEIHTGAESKRVIEELTEKYGKDGIKEMEKYAKEVYDYNHALLRMEYDSGLISQKTYNTLKDYYPYYVPTYRAKYGMGDVLQHEGATGGSSPLIPLHEQMAETTRRVNDACALNDFGYRLMRDMPEGKNCIGEMQIISEEALDSNYITDIAKDTIQKSIDEVDGSYIFNVKVEGKVWKVPVDKHIFYAINDLKNITPQMVGVSQANRLFRAIVTTYNPTFGPTNGIRDLLDVPSFTKHKLTEFAGAYPKAWKMMWGNSELWQVYKSIGGTGGSFVEIGRMFKDGNWFLRNTVERIAQINEAIEQAPRFTEFILTLEKGGNNKENVIRALNNSKELTVNFGRSGTFGRAINANGGTFFNAAMQDVVRMSRAVGEGRVMPLVVGATVCGISPSLINELVCGDDENYQALRTGDKDTNFFIPIGDGKFVKIPKGRVTSALSMPVQRGVRYAMGNTDAEGATKGLLKSTVEQIGVKNFAAENLATPLYEATRPKGGRTWYGSDIVPSSLQRLPAEEQFDENTTKLAVAIGKATHKSPKKIDYVLKQYSGMLGTLIRSSRTLGTPAARSNALTTKFITDAVTNNELQTRVYEKLEEYEALKNSMKSTTTDNLNYKYMNECATKLSKLNKRAKKIQMNESLTDKMKLEKVREIREKQNDLAREYLDSEERMQTASKQAAKQVKKGAFGSETSYQKALKQQMDVNMRGEKAVLKDLDRDAKKNGTVKVSVKIKESGLTVEEYFKLQARGVTLSTYNSAKSKGVSLKKYQAVQEAKKDYSGGYASQAMNMISRNLVNSEDEAEVFGIKKHTYNAAKAFIEAGYTPEQVYELSGNVDDVTDRVRDQYGHDTWSDGTVVMSKEGLKKYIDSQKGLSNNDKHNMWILYGWSRWQDENPY